MQSEIKEFIEEMHKQDIYTMMAGQYEGALEVPLEVLEPYDTVDGKVFYN